MSASLSSPPLPPSPSPLSARAHAPWSCIRISHVNCVEQPAAQPKATPTTRCENQRTAETTATPATRCTPMPAGEVQPQYRRLRQRRQQLPPMLLLLPPPPPPEEEEEKLLLVQAGEAAAHMHRLRRQQRRRQQQQQQQRLQARRPPELAPPVGPWQVLLLVRLVRAVVLLCARASPACGLVGVCVWALWGVQYVELAGC